MPLWLMSPPPPPTKRCFLRCWLQERRNGGDRGHVPSQIFQRAESAFFVHVMKSALFVQTNVAVKTILTRRCPFCLEISMFLKQIWSKTFIVRCNSVWYNHWNIFVCPSRRNIPFHYSKVTLETGAPTPNFLCFLRLWQVVY